MKLRSAAVLLALALLTVLSLAACGDSDNESGSNATGGDGQSLKGMTVALDYVPNQNHAALFWAEDQGYFEDEGLQVKLLPPTDYNLPLKLVNTGKYDIAVSYEPEVILGLAKNFKLQAVGYVIPAPLTSVVAPASSSIHSIKDLAGKTVGEPGIPSFTAMTDFVLETAGLDEGDVKRVNVGFNLIPSVVSGRVDALAGVYSTNEAVQVEEETGAPPFVQSVDELGVPTYDELVFVANSDRLADDAEYRDRVKTLLKAYYRAHTEIQTHKAQALEVLKDNAEGSDFYLKEGLNRTVELMRKTEGLPPGCMMPEEWDSFADWMYESDLLDSKVTGSQGMSNDYLPDAC